MKYLIDMKTTPPVVVLMVRGSVDDRSTVTAQTYADQTQHTVVWADGPDSVADPQAEGVVHPVGHAPAPVVHVAPVTGVNLAPVHAAVAGDIGGVWEYLKSLEPQAVELLFSLLGRLVQKR